MEKLEEDKLKELECMAMAEKETFISKDQEAALALADDNVSIETWLTEGDTAPPPPQDDISEMTGSTRESKAKAYADKAVKEVAAQYSDTISNMKNDIGAKDDKIAHLKLLLQQFKNGSLPAVDNDLSYSDTECSSQLDKRHNTCQDESSSRAKKQRASNSPPTLGKSSSAPLVPSEDSSSSLGDMSL